MMDAGTKAKIREFVLASREQPAPPAVPASAPAAQETPAAAGPAGVPAVKEPMITATDLA
jgi:hypothetical protein